MNNYIRNKRCQQTLEATIAAGIRILLLAGLVSLFAALAVKSIDKHIENQDRMLCFSARKSGNEEYLEKCQCFYETGDITCLQRESK